MKPILLTCLSAFALAVCAFGQSPTSTPTSTPSPSPTPSATATVAASATVAPSVAAAAAPAVSASTGDDRDDDLDTAIRKKVHRHLNATVGSHTHTNLHLDGPESSDAAWMAVPIVGVIFTTLFGAPVLVVGLIMFFSYLKSRSLHRTVKAMVDAGQVVPPELFTGRTRTAKAHSDLRRAVIWMTTGVGMMIFFGAVSGWEGSGPWVIGLIPFLIGAAYLLLGKLEASKDNPPTVS